MPANKSSSKPQQKELEVVKGLMQKYSGNDEKWHYLNALMRFIQAGDTLLARSALAFALNDGAVVAERIGNKSVSDEELKFFQLKNYIEDTEPAWQNTPGSVSWLAAIFADCQNVFNRQTELLAEENDDEDNWQEWEGQHEAAEELLEENKDKEAIEKLKAALLAAERIDYSHMPFERTLSELVELLHENGEPTKEYLERLEKRVSKISVANVPMKALHINSFGSIYENFDNFKKAAELHTLALKLAQEKLATKTMDDAMTLFECIGIRSDLALAYFHMEKFDTALKLLLENADVQGSIFGQSHLQVLETLELAMECSIKAGNSAVIEELKQRIEAIDSPAV